MLFLLHASVALALSGAALHPVPVIRRHASPKLMDPITIGAISAAFAAGAAIPSAMVVQKNTELEELRASEAALRAEFDNIITGMELGASTTDKQLAEILGASSPASRRHSPRQRPRPRHHQRPRE